MMSRKKLISAFALLLLCCHPVNAQYEYDAGGVLSVTYLDLENASPAVRNVAPVARYFSRLLLVGNAYVDENIMLFGSVESWQGVQLRIYRAGIRWQPGGSQAFALRIGKFAAPFGNFVARRYDNLNPLIGRALPYSYRLPIREDVAAPSLGEVLLVRDAVSGFRYTGIGGAAPGLTAISEFSYVDGVQVEGASGKAGYQIAVVTGGLASARGSFGRSRPGVMSRLQIQAGPSWLLAVSAGSTPYLQENANGGGEASLSAGEGRQHYFAADVHFELGHLDLWLEGMHFRFSNPNFSNSLATNALVVETAYRLSPRWKAAGRFSRMAFDDVAGSENGELLPWAHPAWQIEAGFAYRLHRQGTLKLTWQENRVDSEAADHGKNRVFAGQVVVAF